MAVPNQFSRKWENDLLKTNIYRYLKEKLKETKGTKIMAREKVINLTVNVFQSVGPFPPISSLIRIHRVPTGIRIHTTDINIKLLITGYDKL